MSTTLYTLVVILVVIAVFSGFYVVLQWISKRMQETIKRREEYKDSGKQYAFLSILGRPFRKKTPAWFAERINKQLLFAGLRQELEASDILGLMVSAFIIGIWVAYVICDFMGWSEWLIPLVASAVAMMPVLWLKDMVAKRHMQILKDLPYNIDLLTLSVEAGLDFSGAIAKLVEKGKPGPMHDEFRIMLSQMRVGKTRSEAMIDMAERVGLQQLSALVGVLVQADKLGTSIGAVLRVQADQMRVERSQRAEKSANEAPVKILIPLVIFIFPTIWLILAGPLLFEWMFK